jgi:hypothetical protein
MRRLPATTVYYASELWLSFAFAVAFTVSAVYFVQLAPALALYARAIRHGGREPEHDALPEPTEA